MNFLQRLRLGTKVIFGGSRSKSTVTSDWIGQPTYNDFSFTNFWEYGWRRNELIFACINKTANTASQVHLKVRRKGELDPLDDHPLALLLKRPNRYMSEFDLWVAVIIYQKLAGRAIFEKERDGAGRVVALWPLRPDWIAPIPSGDKYAPFNEYEFGPPGGEKVRISWRDVVEFKLWDPMGWFKTTPPMMVAARAGDVDNATTDFLKELFERGGVPAGLLKTAQRLKDAQVETIRRRWGERYGGVHNWMEPVVLDADAEYQKIGMDLREMGFEVVDGREEARICMVLDVPPIIIGAKVGLDKATYSNYAQAREAWWEDSLVPLYVNLEDSATNQLVTEYPGENLEVYWDFSRVPALQDVTMKRWERATRAAVGGIITINQFYREVGMPSIGAPGDVFLRPMSSIEIPLMKPRNPDEWTASAIASPTGRPASSSDEEPEE